MLVSIYSISYTLLGTSCQHTFPIHYQQRQQKHINYSTSHITTWTYVYHTQNTKKHHNTNSETVWKPTKLSSCQHFIYWYCENEKLGSVYAIYPQWQNTYNIHTAKVTFRVTTQKIYAILQTYYHRHCRFNTPDRSIKLVIKQSTYMHVHLSLKLHYIINKSRKKTHYQSISWLCLPAKCTVLKDHTVIARVGLFKGCTP